MVRNAKITEVGTPHDDYVAHAQILSLVGALEARNIIPGAPRSPNGTCCPPGGGVIDQIDALGAPGQGEAPLRAPAAPRPGTIVVDGAAPPR